MRSHRQFEARASIAGYELLARELQHRTKNLFSVILAVASASVRVEGTGSESFIARLHSLAKAQDRIFEDAGSGALLEHVVRSVVESFGARISVEGPRVFLKANVAQGFALIVHELATNAVKHGALTVPTGNISVRWNFNAGVEEPTIAFTWQEHGGPAAIPPEHRGFGMLLLERAVASTNGPPKISFGPGGFSYEITALCR